MIPARPERADSSATGHSGETRKALMATPKNPFDPAYAGPAIYSPATLALYDFVVLTVSNPLVWRCPTWRILAL